MSRALFLIKVCKQAWGYAYRTCLLFKYQNKHSRVRFDKVMWLL